MNVGILIKFGVVGSTQGSVVSDEVSLGVSKCGITVCGCVTVSGTKIGACSLSGELLTTLSREGMSSEKPKAGLSRDKLMVCFSPSIRILA